MKKGFAFCWGPEQQITFRTLSQKLCETPVLALPKGIYDMVVYCDASIMGFGADLMQRCRVIVYASEHLKPNGANYPTSILK